LLTRICDSGVSPGGKGVLGFERPGPGRLEENPRARAGVSEQRGERHVYEIHVDSRKKKVVMSA